MLYSFVRLDTTFCYALRWNRITLAPSSQECFTFKLPRLYENIWHLGLLGRFLIL
uniref:Uncharacterized protein n=1 Tax=Phlebia radiata TaxID=5308 RepID=L8B9G4_PHLRA|nr:hypothetical protein Pra_mt0315 [Phlebia radiata]CCF07383.1 hypothetical protein Pra_mt0315 [Phlebia radiata]